MRNTELEKLDGLVGQWRTISDAWFLEPPGTEVPGSTFVEWIGESFLALHTKFRRRRARARRPGPSAGSTP